MSKIYIMGMSHMMPVIRACSALEEGQYAFFGNGIEPSFIDWETRPNCLPLPLKVATIYIGHTSPFWGPVLARHESDRSLACSPGYRSLLESVEIQKGETLMFVFMNGEEHIHMSRRRHPAPHDFFIPEHPGLPIEPDRQVIPLSVIERQAKHHLCQAKANFSVLRALCSGLRIVNVLCPPPVLGSELSISAPEIDEDGNTNDGLRLKHYITYVKLLEEHVKSLGIYTLHPPLETLTERGMLRKEYTGDPVHGNIEYGRRVLAQIQKFQSATT